MNNLGLLIWEFLKTGLFAVGGGLATIPFLNEMGVRYGWFTMETLSTMIAVSESTPGPIGINMATYVGYSVAGAGGAVAATLSIVTPSIIVICIIANYFQKFKNAKLVKMIFAGLKPAVVGFIVSACLNLFVSTLLHAEKGLDAGIGQLFNWKCICLFAVLYAAKKKFSKLHPIVIISAAAAAGIIVSF